MPRKSTRERMAAFERLKHAAAMWRKTRGFFATGEDLARIGDEMATAFEGFEAVRGRRTVTPPDVN